MQNILDLNAKLCKYNEKGKNNSLIDIWSKFPSETAVVHARNQGI